MKRAKLMLAALALAGGGLAVMNTSATAAPGGPQLVSRGSANLAPNGALGADGLTANELAKTPGEGGRVEGGDEHSTGSATVRPNRIDQKTREVVTSFDGLNLRNQRLANGGNQFTVEPPDQALCVGPNAVMESVNDVLRVYKKDGTPLTGVIDLNTFYGYPAQFDRTTGVQGPFVTDPVCHYDSDTGRWFHVVLTLFVDAAGNFTGRNTLDIAVSLTSNPANGFRLYSLPVQNDGTEGTPNHGCDLGPCIGDYPHIGVDKNGIYLTTNEYSLFGDGTGGGLAYTGANIYAISKKALVQGDPVVAANLIQAGKTGPFTSFTVWPAISPSKADFETANGGTEYFLSSITGDGSETGNTAKSADKIVAWSLSGTKSLDTAAPTLKLSNTFVKVDQQFTPEPIAQTKPGDAPLRDCLNDFSGAFRGANCGAALLGVPPRQEKSSEIDGNDGRMQQVMYADGKIYGALDTEVTVAGEPEPSVGIHWFVVDPEKDGRGLQAELDEQGHIALAGNSVTRPALGVTSNGKAVIGMTVVGDDYHPSAAYAVLGDENPTVHVAGLGKGLQDGFSGYGDVFGGRPRWGDYGAAAVDGDTIWVGNEYIAQSCNLRQYLTAPIGSCGGTRVALGNWATRITAVKVGGDS